MKTKMVSVFAVLMVALMAVGFAYAHWSKIVTIDGTITTGSLHVTPSFGATLDQTKEVATIEQSWDLETNTLTVTLGNVYPCLWVNGWFDFCNDGSIPVALYDVIITPPAGVTYEYDYATGEFKIYDTIGIDGVKTLIATGTLTWERWTGYPQIDSQETVYVDFTLHFEQGLPQITTYTFTVEIVFYNWNEVLP